MHKHIVVKLWKAKDKENKSKNIKKRVIHWVQEIFNKCNAWFLIRNHEGKKRIGWHTQNAERKTTSNQDSYVQQTIVKK